MTYGLELAWPLLLMPRAPPHSSLFLSTPARPRPFALKLDHDLCAYLLGPPRERQHLLLATPGRCMHELPTLTDSLYGPREERPTEQDCHVG